MLIKTLVESAPFVSVTNASSEPDSCLRLIASLSEIVSSDRTCGTVIVDWFPTFITIVLAKDSDRMYRVPKTPTEQMRTSLVGIPVATKKVN